MLAKSASPTVSHAGLMVRASSSCIAWERFEIWALCDKLAGDVCVLDLHSA